MTKYFIIDVYLESKLTKKDFAKKLSISTTTLNNWLSGKSEPLFVNQKIIRQVFKEEISKIT